MTDYTGKALERSCAIIHTLLTSQLRRKSNTPHSNVRSNIYPISEREGYIWIKAIGSNDTPILNKYKFVKII